MHACQYDIGFDKKAFDLCQAGWVTLADAQWKFTLRQNGTFSTKRSWPINVNILGHFYEMEIFQPTLHIIIYTNHRL